MHIYGKLGIVPQRQHSSQGIAVVCNQMKFLEFPCKLDNLGQALLELRNNHHPGTNRHFLLALCKMFRMKIIKK